MDCAGQSPQNIEGDDMTEAGTAAGLKAARIAKLNAEACPDNASSVVPVGRTTPSSATSRLKSAPPPG